MRPVAPRALSLLVSLLESPEGSIVEDLLDSAHQDAFRALCNFGALTTSRDIPFVLCPACGEQDVEPRRVGDTLQALCVDCGYVPVTNASLRAWAVEIDWLLGRLRTALGVASRQDSRELVPGRVWKVADVHHGKRVRRVLLARRLAEPETNEAFRRALNEQVERDQAVLISSTSQSAARVSDLSLPFVHLSEIVHLRSGKLELDDDRWAWCLKPAHLRRHTASPVFYDGYRAAIIDGEEYSFSVNQALVFEALHGKPGMKRLGSTIMADIGSPQRNPGELFRHNARQWEAFCKLVEWDDYGFYWLKQR